jgi:hypothetical protein
MFVKSLVLQVQELTIQESQDFGPFLFLLLAFQVFFHGTGENCGSVKVVWCAVHSASVSGGFGADNKDSEASMEEINLILR